MGKQKQEKNSKYNVKVGCKELRDNWDKTKSVKQNMEELGVAFDANTAMPIKSAKKDIVSKISSVEGDSNSGTSKVTKPHVVESLEKESLENQPKKQNFRFSREQVRWISSMMDKHGQDYKAMARDAKNHFQETPNQIKGKILKFMSIPDHYAVYLRERGLIPKSVDKEEEEEDAGEQEDHVEEDGDEEEEEA